MKLWKKYLIVRADGTVPAWPAFVLGARDPHAPAALRAYAHSVVDAASKSKDIAGHKEYAQALLDMADDFERYAARESEGDPIATPWRTEADDVARAMRGETSVVVTFPDKDNTKTKPPTD